MAIRKGLQWSDSQKRFLGHTTYGIRADREELPLAKNAIVYMIHGVNHKFSFPIAFHFIESLNGQEKVNLLTTIINKITACKARVLSVTFDGLFSNTTMCELLGVNFDMSDFKPFFVLPGDSRKIYIMYDPSHMVKLARNCVANNSSLIDSDNLRIKWNYFVALEDFRVNKGFIHTHKMNKKHIQWKNFKMNVRVAAETLSNSVANSMQYLMCQGFPEFAKSDATIQFIRFVNDVFDVLNSSETSKSVDNKFKNPITLAIDYFKTLKLPKGIVIVKSRTRTAFKGFITNMVNLRCIFEECVKTHLLPSLPTQIFSQDPLESFFGRIRPMGGCNGNPTAEQFCSAFRRLVFNRDIKSAEYNCSDSSSLNILSISSSQKRKRTEKGPDEFEPTSRMSKGNYVLGQLEKVSIANIALSIEKKIETQCRFNCEKCLAIFSENAVMRITLSSDSNTYSTPCQTTFDVCSLAHKYVYNLTKDASYKYDDLLQDIFGEFDLRDAYSGTSFENHEDHKYYCVKYIAEEYIRMQANYIARAVTLKENKILIGNKFRKLANAINQ